MTSGKRFNLANEYCYVLPSYVVITDHSDPNEILRRKERNTFGIFLGFFNLLSISCLAFAFYFIFLGREVDSYTLFIAAAVGFIISVRWRRRSNVRVIERSQIKLIQIKKVMFNHTFVVYFLDKKKKVKERMLVMKSSDPDEIKKAVSIFVSEKLMRPDLQKDFDKVISELALTESKQNYIGSTSLNPNHNSGAHNKSEKSVIKVDKRDSNGYVKNY